MSKLPLPPVAPDASSTAAGLKPSQRTIWCLQRQYYAQLSAQQNGADLEERFSGTMSDRGASLGADRDACAAMVRHRERGDAAETDSLFTSVACTPFSLRTSLGLPLPEHPVRTAAHERQAAAVLCREEHSKGMVPVPLGTAMCELSASGSSELSVQDAHHYSSRNSVAMNPGVSLLPREAGCGQEAGLAVTLHWLKQWGPLLAELLCESAKDDENRVTLKRQRMCHGAGSRNSSSTGGNGSSSSANASVRTMPGSWDRKNQRQRRSPCANKGWLARLLPSNSASTLKKAARWRSGDEARRQQRGKGRSSDGGGRASRRSSGRHTPPAPSAPLSISQLPSKLLSLITDSIFSENSAVNSATRAPQAVVHRITFGQARHSSSAPSVSAMASASVGEDAAQLSKQHQATLHKPNGDWSNKAAPVVTQRPNTTTHKRSLRSQTAGCSP